MSRLVALTSVVLILSSCDPGPLAVPPVPATGTGLPPAAVAPTTAAPVPTSSAPPAQSPRPTGSAGPVTLREFPVPAGSGPHDVAPAADGGVWYTAQRSGELGWLDPKTGQAKHVKLGAGSSPHGVIVGPDGAPWITDSGLNAIVRVDPRTSEVTRYPIPGRSVNLNTAVFDPSGTLWFTGQSGVIGRLQPDSFGIYRQSPGPEIISVPRGAGPYGITAVRVDVYYASLAGNHIAQVFGFHTEAGRSIGIRPIDPPTPDQGARRVWSDSKGAIWVSEWNAGQLGLYEPSTQQWREWKLPGARPQAYAVFVDDRDIVWLSDFGASAIVRFDPTTENFDVFPHAPNGNVRQLHGRPGEVWGALSALDKLIVATTR